MRYYEPGGTYAERTVGPEIFNSGGLRGELAVAVRQVWNSAEGQATREALARAVPRREMHNAMAGLAATIHQRLAPLGPSISRSYRSVWGTTF